MSRRQRHTMTRFDVADFLRISHSSVRRLEGTKLHPVIDDKGRRLFDPREVEALELDVRPYKPRVKPSAQGRLAARVFRSFERGESLRSIVVACKLPPEVVRALWAEWCTPLVENTPTKKRRGIE